MSIRDRIIWLFVAVAIVPMLILARIARQEGLEARSAAHEADLVAAGVAAGAALDARAAVAEASLGAFAKVLTSNPADSLMARLVGRSAAPGSVGLHYLAVLRGSETVAFAGEPDAGPTCDDRGYATSVLVEVPLGGEDAKLVGAYRTAPMAPVDRGAHAWAFDVDGDLVAATSCALPPALVRDLVVREAPPAHGEASREASSARADAAVGIRGFVGEARIVRRESDDGARAILAVAALPELGWTLVMMAPPAHLAGIAASFLDYWLWITVLVVAAVLAFSAFLRPLMGALDDLTVAVERVAGGDLRPWVPVPRNDEVGRLTTAFHDMTDRLRELVARVERSSRLAVLGKMSAYLAHEIRNPLSSVKMNLQRLERWRRAGEIPERFGGAIEVSLREVDRLSGAVSNILQLSPSRTKPREVVALHELVAEVGALLGRDFERRRIKLEWELNAEGDRVLGDPGQLKGVVINLMLNALDAQPDGGELVVRSLLRPGGPEAPGPRLELRFRDRGPGIPPEVAARIFEPFFTTKESGSGIGLAVASQTIQDHGGRLRVEEPRRAAEGAEFVVELPLAAVVAVGCLGEVEPGASTWLEHPAASSANQGAGALIP